MGVCTRKALLETWAHALEQGAPPHPRRELLAAGTDHVGFKGGSGAGTAVEPGSRASPKAWEDDFYLLLSVRPSRGWRRFTGWRANLVAPYAQNLEQMQLFWVQREYRERGGALSQAASKELRVRRVVLERRRCGEAARQSAAKRQQPGDPR